MASSDSQQRSDLEQLRLLAMFHYIVGGLQFLFGSVFLLHVGLGLAVLFGGMRVNQNHANGPPEPLVGLLFLGAGGFAVLLGWTAAAVTIYSGRCLARHRRRMFSLVVAGTLCAFAPFGTVLGVFTIVVLMRDSVRQLYQATA